MFEDNFIHCSCGVVISPLFEIFEPLSKGKCPVCGKQLTEEPYFQIKKLNMLIETKVIDPKEIIRKLQKQGK